MRIRNSINFNLDDFSPSTYHDNAINSLLTNNQEEDDQQDSTELMVIGLLGPTQLSPLEKNCFLGLLELKTNKMLAAENKVSIKSIERRVAKLKSILGAKTRNDFFIIAKKNKLL